MFDQTATFSFYMGVFLVVVSVFIYGDSRFAVKADAPSKSHAVAPSHQSHSHEIRIDTKTVESSASGSSSSTSYAAAGSGLRSHVTTRSIASFSVLSI
jgi:hypothetical protein